MTPYDHYNFVDPRDSISIIKSISNKRPSGTVSTYYINRSAFVINNSQLRVGRYRGFVKL